jgi:hypothetical protein
MAHALSGCEKELAVRLADLFRDLRLSLNKQREILTLLEEIALRENRSMMALLQDEAVQSILSDGDADRNQRSAALRRWLKRRRYPEISRAEAEFEAALRDLPLGEGVQLIPPRHFESQIYGLSLQFKTRSELSRQNRRIGEMLAHPGLEKLLS